MGAARSQQEWLDTGSHRPGQQNGAAASREVDDDTRELGFADLGLNCRHRRRRGAEVRFVAQRGKGSHGTLYYGDRKTIVKDRKKELGSGLLAQMLGNLGIELEELRKRR